MARDTTLEDTCEIPTVARIFSSPVALAFVRIVVERRGVSEAQARQMYLDYLDRSEPAASPQVS